MTEQRPKRMSLKMNDNSMEYLRNREWANGVSNGELIGLDDGR